MASPYKSIPEMKACSYYFYHYNQENELYKMQFLKLHYSLPYSRAKGSKENPILLKVHKSF